MSTLYTVGPGKTYATPAAAVAAVPANLTGTGVHEVVIDAGIYNMGNSFWLTTRTTTASDYLLVRAASGSEHKGGINSGVRLDFTGNVGRLIEMPTYTRVSDLIIINNDSFVSSGTCLELASNCIATNIIVRAGKFTSNAFSTFGSNATYINCLAIPYTISDSAFTFGFSLGNDDIIYNCGSFGHSTGFRNFTTAIVKNSWGFKRSGGSADFSGGVWTGSSNNASSDSTAQGANSLLNITLSQMGFLSSSTGDFHITRGGVLFNAGVDLSSIFTKDIDTQTIVVWSIGFDYPVSLVSSGGYTVGTGGDYSNWLDACTNTATTLTGNLTFTQISDVVETSRSSWATNTNGFLLALTSNRIHRGVIASAWRTLYNSTTDSSVFDITGISGRQSIDISNLYFKIQNKSINFGVVLNIGIQFSPPYVYNIFNNIFDINLFTFNTINVFQSNSSSVVLNVYNNIIFGFNGGGYGISSTCNNTVIENNTLYSSALNTLGIRTSGSGLTVKNNAVYTEGACYTWVDPASSINNASKDSTANGATTTSNNQINRSTGLDFLSVTSSNADWLRPTPTGALAASGAVPSVAANTTGIDGNNRPGGDGHYSIGAFEYNTLDVYQPTGGSPWVNRNKPHRANQSAKAPSLKTVGGQKSASVNKGQGQAGDAQDASIKEGNSETSASVNSRPIRMNTRQKPTKHAANIDGYLAVIPNLSGYINPPVYGKGQRIQFEKESLTIGKEFPQLNSLGDHRTAMDRASLPIAPKGGFQFYPSSNDCITTLMSHFQLRHGSNLAGGTTYYEFAPSKKRLSFSGSSFGTGLYETGSHSFFTVNVTKLVEGTGYVFKNGICDKLGFNFDVHSGFTLEPDFYFKSATLAGSSTLGSTGSYSSLPKFPGHSISATMLNQPVIGLQIYSDNALRPYSQAGTSAPYFGHGKYNIQGNATIDLSKVSLAYIGSMLGTQSFSIVGTLYNDERDKIVISLPNCFMDDFPLSMNSSTMDIPFRAYESENGGTAPMKVQIWTRNYSGTSFEPN